MPVEGREFCDVSVIMPAYRAGKTIARALSSIAAQTLPPREVVVVDDGSDDNTSQAAQSVDMRGIPLKLIRQENQGPGAARNLALTEASSHWVAFLDADDEWLPEKLERSMAVLAADPGLTLVAHDYIERRGDKAEMVACSARFNAASEPFVELYKRGYIDTCSVVTKRAAIMTAGGFDASLQVGQDFDLILKILARPEAKFTVFPEALVSYFIIPGSVTSHTWRRLACQLRILDRHAPSLEGRVRFPLYPIWFRVLAVHKEALDYFSNKKDRLGQIKTLLCLPVALASTLAARPLFLWAWVLTIFPLFVWQFRDLAGPLLRLLGGK
jgi:glycosyltransferase involved in cell wall biosynthesis